MLLRSVTFLAIATTTGVLAGIVRQEVDLQAREAKPKFPYDKGTSPHCSFWYDNDGSLSCTETLSLFSVSIDNFVRWNPSVSLACDNFVESRSYCMEVTGEPAIITTTSSIPPASTTSSSTSTSISISTTSTKPSNGISTPAPTQPDMVGNCNKFYWVNKGDKCDDIIAKNDIPLLDFLTWNPKVGSQCSGLWADTYACVSIIGYWPPPTPTKPNNGVQTPKPTQPGMIENCNKFQYVNTGDSCTTIASKAGISVADLAKWNPQTGGQCTGLWANAYACVGIIPAFRLKTRYHTDCTGNVNNEVLVTDNLCINTGCSVGSLEIDAEGYCPDGQVQISYWEQPNCIGKWFGYGYAKRGECRGVWADGWKFKSLHLRCAKKEDDCVSKKTCSYDLEPVKPLC